MLRKLPLPDDARKAIVSRYDGTTEVIDALCVELGLPRHRIHQIAKAGGYKTTKRRKPWGDDEDEYLRLNWHKKSAEQIAAHLMRSAQSCILRKKRLGIGRYDGADLNIRELQDATGIDHRQWHDFIARGWLKAWEKPRQNGAAPITRVSIDNLKAFLTDHPEVIDLRAVSKYVRALLEADRLPEPPRYKLVSCQSASWESGARATPVGGKIHHGNVTVEDRHHEYTMQSCASIGGTDYWVPTYEASPCCPRCGCKVSRYSDKALYRDDPPSDGETVAILAAKIGLKWTGDAFRDEDGNTVTQNELLKYVFSTKRSPGKAVRVFQKLLEKGMTVVDHRPVDLARLLPNVLAYELRPHQDGTWRDFLAAGALAVGWWPGWGKCYFGAYAMTRLAGLHAVFTHNNTVLEHWLAHLTKYAPRVVIQKEWNPARTRVQVFDHSGDLRCTIHCYSYQTRHEFKDDKYVLVIYDESQFLPGNHSHRKALIECDFRIGLSASPWREDGRADLIGILTGQSVGDDWSEAIETGLLRSVPVHVWLVDDLEHKHAMLANLLRDDKRTVIFSESIADGEEISARNGVPFIYSATKQRLDVVEQNRVVTMSRVGDCGMDVPDLARTIEFSFHGGSRAQSMQRYGRLLHSHADAEHVVLMTHDEHERFDKRLRVLRDKGFRIAVDKAPQIVMAKPVPAPPMHGRSMLATLLGLAAAPTESPFEPRPCHVMQERWRNV